MPEAAPHGKVEGEKKASLCGAANGKAPRREAVKRTFSQREVSEAELEKYEWIKSFYKLFFSIEYPDLVFVRTVDYLYEPPSTDDDLVNGVSSEAVRRILNLGDDERTKERLYENSFAWTRLLFKNNAFENCLTECLQQILQQFTKRCLELKWVDDAAFKSARRHCEALRRGQLIKHSDEDVRVARHWLQKFTGGFVQVDTNEKRYVRNDSYVRLPFERIFLSLVLVHPKEVKGFSLGQEPKQSIGVSGIATKFGHLDLSCPTVNNLNSLLEAYGVNVTILHEKGVVCWNLYPVEGASLKKPAVNQLTQITRKVYRPLSSESLFEIIWQASGEKAIAFWGSVESLKNKYFGNSKHKRTKTHICVKGALVPPDLFEQLLRSEAAMGEM